MSWFGKRLGQRAAIAAGGALVALGMIAPGAVAATPKIVTYGWSAQHTVDGAGGSSAAPALATCANDPSSSDATYNGVYLAWKGTGTDQRIFYSLSSNGGGSWTTQDTVPGGAVTDMTPTIAWNWHSSFQNLRYDAYLVWRGAGSDQQVHYAVWAPSRNGATDGVWQSSGVVPGAYTDTPPRAGYSFSGSGYAGVGVAWKGTGTQAHIVYQHLDLGSGRWNANPAVIVTDSGTSTTPDVTDGPLMVWKGVDSDQRIYYSRGVSGCTDSSSQVCWQAQQNVSGAGGTSAGPAVGRQTLTDGSEYVLVWKGAGSDQTLYYSTAQIG